MVSQLMARSTSSKLASNCFDDQLNASVVFRATVSTTHADSSFVNIRICCFSLSLVIVNEESLGFWIVVFFKSWFWSLHLPCMFPCSDTPDSKNQLVIELCVGLLMIHSFESVLHLSKYGWFLSFFLSRDCEIKFLYPPLYPNPHLK